MWGLIIQGLFTKVLGYTTVLPKTHRMGNASYRTSPVARTHGFSDREGPGVNQIRVKITAPSYNLNKIILLCALKLLSSLKQYRR